MIDRHGNPIPSELDVTPQRARNAFAFRQAFGSRAHAAILAAPELESRNARALRS